MAEAVCEICALAGEAILSIYQSAEPLQVNTKPDKSPVTLADQVAHDIIVAGLNKLTPNLPVLSEEQAAPDFAQRTRWPRYWLVDPLDGTREFIARTGEFTVNVALVEQGVAVIGVVFVPVVAQAYVGVLATATQPASALKISAGGRSNIHVSSFNKAAPLRVLTSSRSHGSELLACLERLKSHCSELEWLQFGSALKFCRLAEGAADIYPRFSPCCEWDTAAGQALLEAAGGGLLTTEFQPLRYNQRPTLINPSFYALADTAADWRLWMALEGTS